MNKKKNIGINAKEPKEVCEDRNCPFHGMIKVRGRTFTGDVTSKDVHKTAKVIWTRQQLLRKFERYEKRRSGIKVHNPPCIDANVGDRVRVVETRPISKTKHFVIIEKIEK